SSLLQRKYSMTVTTLRKSIIKVLIIEKPNTLRRKIEQNKLSPRNLIPEQFIPPYKQLEKKKQIH
ncbi:MAG: hypothetical protein Q8841_02670, partial [Candidatus Phytoplasma australasiaticum]|nr:hypothetical protein [Candidatus Phytoplasma australasiaticum]